MTPRSWAAAGAAVGGALVGVAGLVDGAEGLLVVGEAVIAAWASMRAATTAARCSGDRRAAWRWLAVGFGAWALGESFWAVYEIVLRQDVPVPSLADVGFLLLPPCAGIGLVRHPAARASGRAQRVRLALDGAIGALALLTVAWLFPISSVLVRGDLATASTLVTLAYPVGDVALAAMVLVLLTYGDPAERGFLLWLGAGLLALTAADATFTWLVANDVATALVSPADVLWILGFAVVPMAGARESSGDAPADPREAPPRAVVPLAVLGVAVLAVLVSWLVTGSVGRLVVLLTALLALLAYIRQYMLLRENRQLLDVVAASEELLDLTTSRDQLTGLHNRDGLLRLVSQALEEDGSLNPITVLKFRPAAGHEPDRLSSAEEDEILVELTAWISECLGPGDHLGRVADWVFAVLHHGDQSSAATLAGRILARTEPAVRTTRRWLHVYLCAGVSGAFDRGAACSEELLQQAAIAQARVATQPGGVGVFTPEMSVEYTEHLELTQAVAQALCEDPGSTLELRFQPVVQLADGQLAGLAARTWWHGSHRTVPPERLIDLVSETGLAQVVDQTALTSAVAGFGAWVARWPEMGVRLWIPLSVDTMAGQGFADQVRAVLDQAAVPAERVVLEVLGDIDSHPNAATAQGNLRELRVAGVGWAVRNPVALMSRPDGVEVAMPDYLGIPEGMASRSPGTLRSPWLIHAAVDFAGSHGAGTLALAVSTSGQHEQLSRLGCQLARGALYGPDLTGPETAELLERMASGRVRPFGGGAAHRLRSTVAWQELRKVVSGLPIAAFACDSSDRLVLAEGGLFDALGVSPAQMLGHPVQSLRVGPDVEQALHRALAGQPSAPIARIAKHWIQVHLWPGRDDGDNVTGALGMAIDVTHQVAAEQALRRSEQRFRSFFQQAPVGMAIIGGDARIRQVNQALANLLGYCPEEVVGIPLRTLWHPDSPAETLEQHQRLCSGQTTGYRAERAYRHRDGSPVWAKVSVGPLDTADEPGQTIAIVEDLQQVKKLEVELRHAQKLEAVGMLAAGIAHEINTPIQFVGDNLTFLGDTLLTLTDLLAATDRLSMPVNATAQAELGRLRADADLPWLLEEVPTAVRQGLGGVEKIAGIVHAMRSFGHLDHGIRTPIDVNAAVRDTTTVTRNEYKYVADLDLDLGEVPAVLGNRSEFHQVILNLVVNAAHAISDMAADGSRRGRIGIRTWADADAVHLAVSDNGPGIPADIRDRIFEPFFTTKPVGRGTGQGLAIVYNILERHHGAIRVQSQPDRGTTFTVSLPINPAELPAEA